MRRTKDGRKRMECEIERRHPARQEELEYPGRIMPDSCVHHWILDSRNIGTCRKCGAIRNFAALLRREEQENHITQRDRFDRAAYSKRPGRPYRVRTDAERWRGRGEQEK